jgi:hypothetical protein
MSYYLHNVPGRLRLKTPHIKGDKKKAEEIQNFLSQIPGIQSTSTNTITGSLAIHYNPKIVFPKSITDKLNQAGYFDSTKAINNDQYIFSAASSVLSFVALFV